MTLIELKEECEKQIERGYGDLEIFVESNQENCHIDSIQKDTNPDIEPNYLFIMAGDYQNNEA